MFPCLANIRKFLQIGMPASEYFSVLLESQRFPGTINYFGELILKLSEKSSYPKMCHIIRFLNPGLIRVSKSGGA